MGRVRSQRVHLRAIVLAVEFWRRDRTGRDAAAALLGYRTAVCRYDGLRSEAGSPAACGGSAADGGRHHHGAALHFGSELGEETGKDAGPVKRRRAPALFAHRSVCAKRMLLLQLIIFESRIFCTFFE